MGDGTLGGGPHGGLPPGQVPPGQVPHLPYSVARGPSAAGTPVGAGQAAGGLPAGFNPAALLGGGAGIPGAMYAGGGGRAGGVRGVPGAGQPSAAMGSAGLARPGGLPLQLTAQQAASLEQVKRELAARVAPTLPAGARPSALSDAQLQLLRAAHRAGQGQATFRPAQIARPAQNADVIDLTGDADPPMKAIRPAPRPHPALPPPASHDLVLGVVKSHVHEIVWENYLTSSSKPGVEETVAFRAAASELSVDNLLGMPMGKVDRRIAHFLAQLLAARLITLAGSVPSGYPAGLTNVLPLTIVVSCSRSQQTGLVNFFAKASIGLFPPTLAQIGSRMYLGLNPAGAAVPARQPYAAYTQDRALKEYAEAKNQLDEVYDAMKGWEDLEETEPSGDVRTGFYPHQRQALTFMLRRERDPAERDAGHNIWRREGASFRCVINGEVRPRKGEENFAVRELRGGLVADDMGLGKTIQVLALVLSDPERARPGTRAQRLGKGESNPVAVRSLKLRIGKRKREEEEEAEAPPPAALALAESTWRGEELWQPGRPAVVDLDADEDEVDGTGYRATPPAGEFEDLGGEYVGEDGGWWSQEQPEAEAEPEPQPQPRRRVEPEPEPEEEPEYEPEEEPEDEEPAMPRPMPGWRPNALAARGSETPPPPEKPQTPTLSIRIKFPGQGAQPAPSPPPPAAPPMQRPMQVQQQQQPYPFGGVAPSRPVALQGSLYAIQQGMASQPPAQPPPAMRPGFPDARTAASIGSPATPTFSETSSRPGGRKKKDDETFYPEPVVSSPGTLIICPLSTVTNWEEQIAQHCRPGTVGAYVYHGGGRNQSAEQLSLHDVVITTYNVLSIEYGRMARAGSNARNDAEGGFLAPLHAIEWHRVVLDEAHTIKDASTAQSKAACSINARRRWCLTGTPIQNKLDDLYALIKFLRVQPFDEKLAWTTTFTRPLRSADPIGVSRLQTLMKLVTIRRTKTMKIKGQPIVSLPPREDRVESVELGPFERKLYDAAHRQSKEIFERLVQNDNVMRNYVHVLEILLRLRQLVTHPGLVKRSQIDFANLKLEESSVIDLSDESAVDAAQSWETYNLLRDSGEDYCCRCQEQVVDATSGDVDPRYAARAPVVSRCGHLYCKGCVEAGLKQNAFECRMCSRIVTTTDVLELNEASLEAVTKQTMAKAEKTIKLFMKGPNGTTADATITVDPNKLELLSPYDESAKVRAIIADLRQVRLDAQTAGTEMPKSVIFSQWTGMLDILQNHLTYHEFGFTRLDGKMSRPDRSAAIQTFRSDPDCTVMLVSLKAGGVGLNLTMASRAYLVEPYWNPSVENQAVDRIHRMGQTKPVTTIRLIVKDSVEDNILALQKKKLALANMALERDERGKGKGTSAQQKEEMARQRLKDLKELFK